jgi:hypothetical protein
MMARSSAGQCPIPSFSPFCSAAMPDKRVIRQLWYKQELVINPLTYTYMGDKSVAIKAHDLAGTDGTRHVRKGHVLGWEALLKSAIVQHARQLP